MADPCISDAACHRSLSQLLPGGFWLITVGGPRLPRAEDVMFSTFLVLRLDINSIGCWFCGVGDCIVLSMVVVVVLVFLRRRRSINRCCCLMVLFRIPRNDNESVIASSLLEIM